MMLEHNFLLLNHDLLYLTENMSDTFVKTLIEAAKADKNIELITGDLGFGVLKPYWEELPDRFTNAGIAEQHMLSMAAGMSLEGKTAVVYSIGNFPTARALEQIRNDCAYHNLNVKIVCVGGGFVYGSLGMSHHATEDIAIMRALPNVTVLCPGDLVEAQAATRAMLCMQGTCYLRLGRGGEQRIHNSIENFKIGRAIKIQDCTDKQYKVAILSTGAILDEAYQAVCELAKQGIAVEQYSFPTVKPLDMETIIDGAKQYDYIFTLEEHNIIGGLGGAVAEVLAESGLQCRLVRMGINDCYCATVGDQKYLREMYGISASAVVARVQQVLADCK